MSAAPPFLTRVRIRNYRSIAACDVELGSLAFLVGPNGSGKSNFLDAIRFVADALYHTLDYAYDARGGTGLVHRRTSKRGRLPNIEARLDFRTPSGITGHYGFEIATRRGGFSVRKEECVTTGAGEHSFFFRDRDAFTVKSTLSAVLPAAAPDRLFLKSINDAPFREIYDALVGMRSYNLNPGVIREPQEPDPGEFLKHDGRNLAGVLADLRKRHTGTMERIERYLGVVVPGVRSVNRVPYGTHETIDFHQNVPGQEDAIRFSATSMSDGTLRALGILTALLQENSTPPTLVGIEEPETALHPAALAALIDAFQDAREQTQVLVATHSPELLYSPEVQADELLAVSAESGETIIGPINAGSRESISQRRTSAGELLSLNLLEPDEDEAATDGEDLFDF